MCPNVWCDVFLPNLLASNHGFRNVWRRVGIIFFLDFLLKRDEEGIGGGTRKRRDTPRLLISRGRRPIPCSAVRLDWGPGAQATGPAHLPRREHVTRARQCSGPLGRTALVFPKCAMGKGLPAVVQSIVRTRSRSSLQKHILFLFFLFVKDKPSGVLLDV